METYKRVVSLLGATMTNYETYQLGFLAGLREYAWWKDGTSYVGSCGTTLEEAIEFFNKNGSVVSGIPEDIPILRTLTDIKTAQ